MKYARYYTQDVVNGEGMRVVLFVSGCSHGCDGCYNKSTWSPAIGTPYTEQTQELLLELCASHDGLTLSGGDPLYPANRPDVTRLCQSFKARYPEKDIWLWTGYLFEEVEQLAVMQYVDFVIDGRYDKARSTTKPWRGSANQRLVRLSSSGELPRAVQCPVDLEHLRTTR